MQKIAEKMEDAYEKLKKEGKNTVEHLVQWMQDAKVIENAEEAKVKANKLFDGALDKTNVEIEHFKEAISKLAVEQKKTNEDLTKSLTEQAPKFLEALAAAAAAFKETLTKK